MKRSSTPEKVLTCGRRDREETGDLQGARRPREETNVLWGGGLCSGWSKKAPAAEPDPGEKSYLVLLPHLSEGLGVLLFPPGETHILQLGQPRPPGAAPCPALSASLLKPLSSMPAPQPDQITCSAAPPLLSPSCFALHVESVESSMGNSETVTKLSPSVPPCSLLSPQPHNVLRSRIRF